MRIVTSTDLSEEQEDILLDTPLSGVVLILGPPGSGKTVMAFLRADALVKRFDSVTLIMFNKVLQTFSKNAAKSRKIDVRTMHSWIWKWWRGITRQGNVPEVEKYVYDWNEIFSQLAEKKSSGSLNLDKVDWKHLILDEGQDFTKEMYQFLDMTRNMFFHGKDIPSLTILADENQRLNEDNSTIADIKNKLRINDDHVFHLTKNYRNTDQINSLIGYFYVGNDTGMTKPSGKNGEKPKLLRTTNFESTVNYIVRYIKTHENEEIAIIVANNKIRSRYHKAIEERLDSKYFYVQTYASKDYKWKDTGNLRFDKDGIVTILNKQSCKGLEFDAVFIPELHSVDVADDNITGFKMEMYVMCSRARSYLALMSQNANNEDLPIFKYLPPREDDILEYIDV